MNDARCRVVVVSGLSGAGKSSILRALEDLGYEAVDNPPLSLLDELIANQTRRGCRLLAVGIDARTSGFDAASVRAMLDRLHQNPSLRPELVYAWADETALLRRYTETRRRHPLAPQGRVVNGIAAEIAATAILRETADMVIDTSDLPPALLRQAIEQRFGNAGAGLLTVSLVSFGFPRGLPREADMVFDARFLRNPHYDPVLRPRTGLDPEVGAYVEADPGYAPFFRLVTEMLDMVLPRFVQEGKKYATIAIGCTGGRHRSIYIVERLAAHLVRSPSGQEEGVRAWKVTVTHRELARENGSSLRPTITPPVQAQEA